MGDVGSADSASQHSRNGVRIMGLLWAIISWIIIGGIIGLIARAIMPGKQSLSLGLTIVLGVVGALVGGLIGGLFGGDGISGIMSNPWSWVPSCSPSSGRSS